MSGNSPDLAGASPAPASEARAQARDLANLCSPYLSLDYMSECYEMLSPALRCLLGCLVWRAPAAHHSAPKAPCRVTHHTHKLACNVW